MKTESEFQFDMVPDRRESGSVKWEVGENELPMWVADMDFPTCPAVREALEARVAHGVFGYTDVNDEALMLTGDDNLVRVEAVCQYSVRDAQSYLYEVDKPESTMKLAFETALRRNIQNKALDDALLNKATIEQEVIPDFQRMLDSYGIGVTVREIRIQNITVPTEVNAAYEDVNNAKNEKTRKLDEAEKYSNEVIPVARSEAYQMVQEAEAYKSEVISQATGDVANFNSVYEEYVSSQSITRKRLMIETMERILENADSKVVIDGDGDTLRLLPIEPSAKGE